MDMIKEQAVRYTYHVVYQMNLFKKRAFFDFNKEIKTKDDILAVERIIESTQVNKVILIGIELLAWNLLETNLDDAPRYDLRTLSENFKDEI